MSAKSGVKLKQIPVTPVRLRLRLLLTTLRNGSRDPNNRRQRLTIFHNKETKGSTALWGGRTQNNDRRTHADTSDQMEDQH